MRALELRIPPLAVALAIGLLMTALARAVPGADFNVPGSPLPALGLMILGAAIVVTGWVTFRRHKTTVNPFTPEQASSLVVSGVFRFTRNPIYLGLLLVLSGLGLHLANGVALLALPLFIAYMTRFQIQPEERALREKFGQSFVEYTRAVRRWI